MTIATLAKKLSPKKSTTQAQPPANVELGRGVVTALNGDGTVTINLNGSTLAVIADDVSVGTAQVGGIVEVLVAPPRLAVLPHRGRGTLVEMYALGTATGAMVGTIPAAGHVRPISITWVGACATGFGISTCTIDMTSVGLSTGYNVVLCSGDVSTTAVEATPAPLSSSLTSLEVLVGTAAGATLPNGTTVRLTLILAGG